MKKLASAFMVSPLSGLAHLRNYKSKRVSSWDRTGGNADFITIPSHKRVVFADIKGAGCIRHIWITIACKDKYYMRKILLRMYWDGEANPSVECPIGDFFGVGHGLVNHFVSLPLSMITGGDDKAALNCYFPMPFAESARIEVENECDVEVSHFYYHVDYELYDAIDEDLGRFHACWNRENPCKALDTDINLTGKDNYVILEAVGKGHYVGCNLSIHNLSTDWFGEGDDMIFIDGEGFPPSLHGTGTEDYFCAAWAFPTGVYYGPYHGISLAGNRKDWTGKWTAYRFHIEDPIAFDKSIRVTIEHGHANNRSDDYSSVAYWYQTEPHKKFKKMLNVAERLPRENP